MPKQYLWRISCWVLSTQSIENICLPLISTKKIRIWKVLEKSFHICFPNSEFQCASAPSNRHQALCLTNLLHKFQYLSYSNNAHYHLRIASITAILTIFNYWAKIHCDFLLMNMRSTALTEPTWVVPRGDGRNKFVMMWRWWRGIPHGTYASATLANRSGPRGKNLG